jgi:hypothetical protein
VEKNRRNMKKLESKGREWNESHDSISISFEEKYTACQERE